jgi:transposase-like protein
VVRQAERDQGLRAGPTTKERERIKALVWENCELRQVNEILGSRERSGSHQRPNFGPGAF